jgi:hypothetical protein
MKRKILALITYTSLAVMVLSACGSTVDETSNDEVQDVSQTVALEDSTEENSSVEETTTEAVEMETAYLISKRTEYDADGNILSYETYEYDDNNNLVSRTEYLEDGTSQPSYKAEYYSSGVMKFETEYYNGMVDVYIEYDENGNNIAESYYEDGEVYNSFISEYDSNGNEIKRTHSYYGSVTVTDYEYDENNTLIHEIERSEDGSIIITEVTYDSYGNEIDDISNNDDGTLYYKYHYDNEYDSNENLIKVTSHYSSSSWGDSNTIYKYEYDSNGNCIKEYEFHDDDSEPYSIIENEYDGNDNLLKSTEIYYDELLSERQYEYNADGNVLSSKLLYYDGDSIYEDLSRSYQCTYDSNGNEITMISYSGDGSMDNHFEYEYIAIEVPVE